ncbi:ABC transporter ATP-binding protein [Oceanotoga sp. DSM 15011]|jgi:iron complex transport system ATP-binding protein|uniref:Iron complex transport system ATP-binding protein n=1 Tax=Oceanotoga teriensis TaxID=515440 RepID=A0AA45C8P4_9BACT|nr:MULTISPECIES: ABC transporter ATP-binding protein [Oceanotoga]MDN5342393.1 cobalamin transport system ATP-binding protein [Oceanotoga sp.]MDO7975526.1 ABC transporter ATP-binding protein [Oceanotoga teriensis]PWJ96186.1 iron complex transport system ATP-binding protein [Oceanotoga teriensis]UYO99969.1 ABC transporter ATP-binding protein [Oceanotoga sp. DSM 15011]
MIQINNIKFNYGNGFNLDIKNLHIKNGEIVSIIGPNGAGKSTLIKLISKILPLKYGNIFIDSKNLKSLNLKELSKLIAVVPQEFNTIFDYSVKSIVETSRLPYSKKFDFFTENKEDENIISNSMKKTDTYKFKEKSFSNLSGGEKQRVMVARAFAQKSKILLLDEFSSHLDPGHTQYLLNIIKNLSQKENLTILSVFHDINLASLYSNRILIMKDGKIIKDGTPNEVITKKIIEDIYNFKAEIIIHPKYKIPQVIFQ